MIVKTLPTKGRTSVMLVAICLASSACSKDSDVGKAPRAPADAVPGHVTVSGGEIEAGVQLGKLRQKLETHAFAISRLPTTVAQYAQCINAGVCDEPQSAAPGCSTKDRGLDGATYSTTTTQRAQLSATTALTCATAEQAARYCRWVGGRLPRVDEWLLAARGPKVARFAWGNEQPTCERHWRAAFEAPSACCLAACDSLDAAVLDAHPGGNSPAGIADVLATPGELVVPAPGAAVLGCTMGAKACVISGLMPGAIDFISVNSENTVSGFRCAWES